jgi:hypothetical protein
MPVRIFRTTIGGWSYWEPTDPVCTNHPRVFFSKRSAHNALTAWLMGQHRREYGTTYDWEGTPDGYDNHLVDAPKIPRHREDMEIVAMLLTEVAA